MATDLTSALLTAAIILDCLRGAVGAAGARRLGFWGESTSFLGGSYSRVIDLCNNPFLGYEWTTVRYLLIETFFAISATILAAPATRELGSKNCTE